METGVEREVLLFCDGDERYPLDIAALAEYSGQGKCDSFGIWNCLENFREQLRAWAQSKDWLVVENSSLCFMMKRILDIGNFM